MVAGYWSSLKRRLTVWPRTVTERNILCLYIEVVLASVLAAAGSFDSAYVLRLGGSSRLVGLLASLPALVAIVTYLPSARVLQRKARYGP